MHRLEQDSQVLYPWRGSYRWRAFMQLARLMELGRVAGSLSRALQLYV